MGGEIGVLTHIPNFVLLWFLVAWAIHVNILPRLLSCEGDLVWAKPNDVSVLLVDK